MRKVIDLSKYNTVTDWSKVKAAVDGVFLRAGYRGYGSGKIVEDQRFAEYARACKSHGIPFGLYFMSQAITAPEGREEAEFAIEKAKEYGATLPIFIDSEDGDGTARVVRADGLSKTVRTAVVQAFCEKVQESGYKAGVYASESWFVTNLFYDLLKDKCLIWVAKYGQNTGKPSTKVKLSKADMWQYTSKGTVAGIKGNVDLNECYFTDKEEKTEVAPEQPVHTQLNYKQGEKYQITATGLRKRTKKASQSPDVLPTGDVLGTIPTGTIITNHATARVGESIWMYFGLDEHGREQWVCADTGLKAYVEL